MPLPRELKILVADDEPEVLAIVREVLEGQGHAVMGAEDGLVALRVLSAGGFDLLVTDLNMPGMSGNGLANRARLMSPKLKVLMMTTDPSAAREADAVIEKPFAIGDLQEAVRQIFPPGAA